MVVDGQRAHDRGRLLLAVAHVRLLADEVLVLDLAPRHPGLDDVVLALELGAVRAVALLQPAGGPVDADPDGDDPVRRAGLGDDVPQPRALLDRDVQLPAEIADVGDPRREHLQRPDLDRAAAREREALVRDVVAGDAREDVARARAPQPERAPRARLVADLRRAVLGEVVLEPLQVGHPVRAAGDDAEHVVGQAHDRQVGLEAAARGQDRRVDDAPDRHVHLAHRDPLDGVERAGPGDVEDRERGQVDHRRSGRASPGARR